MTTRCIKAIISGRVQGVFYRSGTCKEAKKLNLTGWVKNNADDTVELIACGTEENINALIEWLWQGPLLSHVTKVDWQNIPEEKHTDFIIER